MRRFLCALFFLGILSLISCTGNKQKKPDRTVYASDIEKGKSLAIKYCQSCHMLPEPSWLNTKTWEQGVLPQMGPRLGVFNFNGTSYPYSRVDLTLDKNFYPSKPLVTEEEWQQILDYYIYTSPDSINENKNRVYPSKEGLSLFQLQTPSFKNSTPATSFVRIDTASTQAPFVIADAMKTSVYRYNSDLKEIDSLKVGGPIVNIEEQKQQWIACNIGIIHPNNGTYGNVLSMDVTKPGKADYKKLFSGLQRPVQATPVDLNNDGKEDYLICEFGFLTGALSWMENKGDSFLRHVIRPLPGAIKAYVEDYNHDGLQDFWVLFAQGEEGIFLYTNEGNGKFSEKEVLRFPPVYGSSYFEMDDFNKDGFPDILYTCGDNADYSPILKPFHGIYIYLNDGHNQFKQQYFYPLNGCYKAIARDYDNDGDLDIAAISFFADYVNHPEESLVYLKNNGNYNFTPYSLPGAQTGRWLTMDAGDFDHDGKIDLIIGNFAVAPLFITSSNDWKDGPPFIILKNTGNTR
ncbi:MAG: VCBS repeat-containing protein [Chitinophagaceae bacterium]